MATAAGRTVVPAVRRLSVCLVNPLIAQNTGNVGRTCLAFGASLHLVKPLGFSLDDKAVKRAGLDYWPRVDVSVHEAWQDFEDNLLQHVDRVVFYSKQSKHGTVNALDADLTGDHVCLVFGSEDKGLDSLPPSAALPSPRLGQAGAAEDVGTGGGEATLREQTRTWAYVPMEPGSVRSLNLSNTVAMACFDALKQNRWPNPTVD